MRRSALPFIFIALAPIALTSVLAACGTHAVREDRFTGTLSGCGDTPATLVTGPEHFSFTPSDGVLVVTGEVSPDGRFAGSLTIGAASPDKPSDSKGGVEKKKEPFVLRVEGQVSGDAASGSYATPRCQATFQLTRRPRPLLPF
jgi:hypothetical protein